MVELAAVTVLPIVLLPVDLTIQLVQSTLETGTLAAAQPVLPKACLDAANFRLVSFENSSLTRRKTSVLDALGYAPLLMPLTGIDVPSAYLSGRLHSEATHAYQSCRH